MRIICDTRENWAEELCGWSEMPISPTFSNYRDLAVNLWRKLVSEQSELRIINSLEGSGGFWNDCYLVGKSEVSQYDLIRNYFSHHPEKINNLACLALSGKNFHGQHQRPWQAIAGNIHLTVAVPLNQSAQTHSLAWTMLPAVAVMQTLEKLGVSDVYSQGRCGIKWVNDVLWDGLKLAGVISSLVSENGRLHRGYLGIGLNVAQAPGLPGTTCLHHKISPQNALVGHVFEHLLASLALLIARFNENSEGENSDYFLEQYRRYCLVVGRKVRIMSDPINGPGELICQGRVLAVNSDLSLSIEGHQQPIVDGRLVFQE